MVWLKPLGSAEDGVFQLLLTLDGRQTSILVDVGWDQTLAPRHLEKLEEKISEIDLVLLTHATLNHLGAFAWLRHKHPAFRKAPVYATLPVIRLGQLLTVEAYRSKGLCGPFVNADVLDAATVEELFAEITPISYSQPLHLRGSSLENVTITAYNAGHTLGGTLWKVVDTVDDIVVALDWNHARDAHLRGAFLESKVGRVAKDLVSPSLLVTTSQVSQVFSHTKARAQFLELVQKTLSKNGIAFIPTSPARMLELVLVLEEFLIQQRLKVPLLCCSRVAQQAVAQASAMLEWMVPSIISEWQVQNESPFQTRKVRYVQSVTDLRADSSAIVLVVGECLEQGPARQLFFERIAAREHNSLILTEPCPPNTLARLLLDSPPKSLVGFEYTKEQSLTGAARRAYLAKKEAERNEHALQEAQDKRNKELIDASASQDASDSSDEEEVEDVRHDFNGATTSTFPYTPKRRRRDDYGEHLPAHLFKKRRDELEPTEARAPTPPPEERVVVEMPVELVTCAGKAVIKCGIHFADMSGITNARSLEMIYKQVHPAKVCAIPGGERVCEWLSTQSAQFEVLSQPVFFPRTNFAVDVRIDAGVPLDWHSVSNTLALSRVTGSLEFDAHDKSTKTSATLLPAPAEGGSDRLTLGDLRLATLRKDLTEMGFKAEFKGQNELMCNDKVAVRQLSENEFCIDGAACEDYYTVRTLMQKYITTI